MGPSGDEVLADGMFTGDGELGFQLGTGGTAVLGYLVLLLQPGAGMGMKAMFTAMKGLSFSAAPFASVAVVVAAVAAGALAGYMAAEALGLESGAATAMTLGGAFAGAGIATLIILGAGNAWNYKYEVIPCLWHK